MYRGRRNRMSGVGSAEGRTGRKQPATTSADAVQDDQYLGEFVGGDHDGQAEQSERGQRH